MSLPREAVEVRMDVQAAPAPAIDATRDAIVEGSTSVTAIAEAYYTRIAERDGPSGDAINSFLALTRERAMAQADRIDRMASRGEPLPPLAGVPVGIKDVLAMQGAPATAGSLILKGYRPPYDATVVQKLESSRSRAARQAELRRVRHGFLE